MEPIIEFENFTFKYRSQMEPTLRDINLKIYPGEKVLIIGPSGSGKSTLSNCINGLIPFSYEGDRTGTLKIEGKDPKKLGIFGRSKMVGTVLQDTDGQFIGLTVAEDIAFVLENDCMAQEEMFRKVDGVAETVEVKELLHHAPSEMSGGQKQRVSMAGVMIDDVDILLFDEPLANLDPATGKKAIALIDRIQKEQKKTAAEERRPTVLRMLLSKEPIDDKDLKVISPAFSLNYSTIAISKEKLQEIGDTSNIYRKIVDSLINSNTSVPMYFCKEDEVFNLALKYLKNKEAVLEFIMQLRSNSYAYRYNKVSMKADDAVRKILLSKGYYKKNSGKKN